MSPIKAICKAETPHSLLSAVIKAFKCTMNVKKVNFYFLNLEVIEQMAENGVKFTPVRVQT